MTRKDHRKIVAALCESQRQMEQEENLDALACSRAYEITVGTFVMMLKLDNPRFDVGKFVKECVK